MQGQATPSCSPGIVETLFPVHKEILAQDRMKERRGRGWREGGGVGKVGHRDKTMIRWSDSDYLQFGVYKPLKFVHSSAVDVPVQRYTTPFFMILSFHCCVCVCVCVCVCDTRLVFV